jgi:hypothetical protein
MAPRLHFMIEIVRAGSGVVEVVQGEVIANVATRDYVGEQIALVRQELAEQIGAVRQELAEQIGAVRQELAEQIGAVRHDLTQETGSIRAELAPLDRRHENRADARDQPPHLLDERLPCRAPRRRPRALRHSDRQAVTAAPAYGLASRRRRMSATIASGGAETSTVIASSGSSSVASWLASRLAGM